MIYSAAICLCYWLLSLAAWTFTRDVAFESVVITMLFQLSGYYLLNSVLDLTTIWFLNQSPTKYLTKPLAVALLFSCCNHLFGALCYYSGIGSGVYEVGLYAVAIAQALIFINTWGMRNGGGRRNRVSGRAPGHRVNGVGMSHSLHAHKRGVP